MSGLFTSRYPGNCNQCGDRIEEGDDVAYIDGWKRPCCRYCWITEDGAHSW